MVREILLVQFGQCGNQIGNVFWTTMSSEHRLAKDGKFKGKKENPDDQKRLDKINVYYQETSELRFVPRACLVDLEPGILDAIKAGPMSSMFKPDNFVFGASGAANNWALGHYLEGSEIIDEVVDVIRKETESCDCPQGFQITQSIGGGTGSGLGTLTLWKIRDNYPDRITCTYSVYPSPKVSDIVLEPYNATLSIHELLENSDETFVIDNEALFNISHNVLKQKEPKYSDLNWVISLVMSGITASLRFSGQLNSDLRKMGVNLVPFPRLHFFLVSHSPLFAPNQSGKVKLTVQELTDQMWSSRNCLANVKSDDGKYMTASCSYRGNISTQEIDDEMAKVNWGNMYMADGFVSWIPDNIKSSSITISPEDTPISGTFVANTTAIKQVFQRISAQFAKMYKRKAFLHAYTGSGMDQMKFVEADKNVRDLITEYQDKQDAVIDLEYDDDDDDSQVDDSDKNNDNDDDGD